MVTVSAELGNVIPVYVCEDDKWLSTVLLYIWSEQISCIILLLSSGTLHQRCPHTHTNLQFLSFVKLVKTLEYPAVFIGKPEGSYDRPEETPETSSRVNLART